MYLEVAKCVTCKLHVYFELFAKKKMCFSLSILAFQSQERLTVVFTLSCFDKEKKNKTKQSQKKKKKKHV